MTSPDDNSHYIGILEAVVAVLAVKCGMHPEVMMRNAIQDLTHQANMDTLDSDRLINDRWTNRNIAVGKMAASAVSLDDVRGVRAASAQVQLNQTAPQPTTMAARLADRRARQASEATPVDPEASKKVPIESVADSKSQI